MTRANSIARRAPVAIVLVGERVHDRHRLRHCVNFSFFVWRARERDSSACTDRRRTSGPTVTVGTSAL